MPFQSPHTPPPESWPSLSVRVVLLTADSTFFDRELPFCRIGLARGQSTLGLCFNTVSITPILPALTIFNLINSRLKQSLVVIHWLRLCLPSLPIPTVTRYVHQTILALGLILACFTALRMFVEESSNISHLRGIYVSIDPDLCLSL